MKKKLANRRLARNVKNLKYGANIFLKFLDFEKRLDHLMDRKRIDFQQTLRSPLKQKRVLRVNIFNQFYPNGSTNLEASYGPIPYWELKIEGHLLENGLKTSNRKFSTFFKSLVVKLDEELYGPDFHVIEWHKSTIVHESDGFQVTRPGDRDVSCTIQILLDNQLPRFKLHPVLHLLLGIRIKTLPEIISALWHYIKVHKLQDPHDKEYITCNRYLRHIFACKKIKMVDIPSKLKPWLHARDPIVINHLIKMESSEQKSSYDIDIELDHHVNNHLRNFIFRFDKFHNTDKLDKTISETIDSINEHDTREKFFLDFSRDPQETISKWLTSQTKDLKTMTDIVGNPEEERRAEFYYQAWTNEAISRYIYRKGN